MILPLSNILLWAVLSYLSSGNKALAVLFFAGTQVINSLFSLFASGIQSIFQGSGEISLTFVSTAYFIFIIAVIQPWQIHAKKEIEEKPGGFETRIQALAVEAKLTKRETEVFRYLAQGFNSPYIARVLFISENTVRSHMKSIYAKMTVSSKEELIELVHSQR